MNEFESLIKNINPDVIKKIQSFAKSSEGQKMIEKFRGMDKNEILNKVSAMSDEDKKKLADSLNKNPDIMTKLKGMN